MAPMENNSFTGQLLDDKYLILSKLGEGGMGAVYEGEHAAMGKKVAVKILHSMFKSNEEVVKRFFREARAAAAISHRNIIDVLDMGVAPTGEPFLIMEYLTGVPLDGVLKSGPMDLDTAIAVLEPALAAIGAAHAKGVVHRDLKPENIFLNKPVGGAVEVKLIDFGISKFQDTQVTKLTMEGTTLGTPAYMSPEQIRGAADIDHLTDIYSIGIILYEMLCGKTPFEGEQYNQLLANILMSEPRLPTTLYDAFPMVVWPVIQQAIAKMPADRFSCADQMMAALDEICPADRRAAALAVLDKQVETMVAAATGDVGAPTGHGQSDGDAAQAASQILSDLVQQGTKHLGTAYGATQVSMETDSKEPDAEKSDDHAVLAHGLLQVTRAALGRTVGLGRTLWTRGRYELMEGEKKGPLRIGVLVSVVLLVALLMTMCGGRQVSIEVVGLPDGATVRYDGEEVDDNPFNVAFSEEPHPVEVHRKGRLVMKVRLVPTVDQKVHFTTRRRVRVTKVTPDKESAADRGKKGDAASSPSGAGGEKGAAAGDSKSTRSTRGSSWRRSSSTQRSGASGGDKRTGNGSSRNPFKRLRNELRRTFRKR